MKDSITMSELEAYRILVNSGEVALSDKKNDRKAVHEATDKIITLAEKIKEERIKKGKE